LLDGVLHG
jgi:hypothetical protein